MQEFGCGFVPLYADYAQMIDCTVEALDEYGRWLGEQVRTYDPRAEPIGDLRDLLVEVHEVLGAVNRIAHQGDGEERYGIDMSDLPSIEIPEGIDTSYPVWAMSSTGGMLTGECADCVETILDVIRAQNPDLDEDDLVQREDLPDGRTESARGVYDRIPSDEDLATENVGGWLPVEEPILHGND